MRKNRTLREKLYIGQESNRIWRRILALLSWKTAASSSSIPLSPAFPLIYKDPTCESDESRDESKSESKFKIIRYLLNI